MTSIDWIIFSVPLILVLGMGIYAQRYMRSVADFVSGGRVAGRYLLAVGGGEMSAGAVVFAALFEMIGQSGFTLNWWGWMTFPIGVAIAITGFVVFRYRETRAMTMGQFFEIRYSKNFRLFTGMLSFLAGLLNFGIIPAVGARFLSYYMGFPPEVAIFSITVPTYTIVMLVTISITVILTISGGLITVMVTDCMEGIISQIFYLLIIGALLMTFSWSDVSQVLETRAEGHSLLNPFDSGALEDFNIWYVLMGIFVTIYGTSAWNNASAYRSAGLTPHESRMGQVLGRWREMGKIGLVALLAVCAMTFLESPEFAQGSVGAKEAIGEIADPQIQQQMQIPIAVSHLLPEGIKGAFLIILLMGVFGGDSTHFHSWSGLFIQDVLVPLRKKPFTPKQHIRLLRLSVIGVAIFVFFFGVFFPLNDYIIMWWAVTMAVYVGGTGAVIIGGLYWKKGTTAGAWTALTIGSTLSLGGIVAKVIWPSFPLNGMEVSFLASLLAAVAYVGVSLLTCREDFEMERMLHREVDDKIGEDGKPMKPTVFRDKSWVGRLLNYNENFTTGDKWITGCLFGWSLWWFTVFFVGTIWNLISPWPVDIWSKFWHVVGIGLPVTIAGVSAIWFTWGGIKDIRSLFRRLRDQQVNIFDDGSVVGHQNLDEIMAKSTEINPNFDEKVLKKN